MRHVEEEFGQSVNLDRLLAHFDRPLPNFSLHRADGLRLTAMSRRYVIISPCRNEAEFMRQTLDTVVAQTIRPTLWVIVDDGSTDDTPRILDEYAAGTTGSASCQPQRPRPTLRGARRHRGVLRRLRDHRA